MQYDEKSKKIKHICMLDKKISEVVEGIDVPKMIEFLEDLPGMESDLQNDKANEILSGVNNQEQMKKIFDYKRDFIPIMPKKLEEADYHQLKRFYGSLNMPDPVNYEKETLIENIIKAR